MYRLISGYTKFYGLVEYWFCFVISCMRVIPESNINKDKRCKVRLMIGYGNAFREKIKTRRLQNQKQALIKHKKQI